MPADATILQLSRMAQVFDGNDWTLPSDFEKRLRTHEDSRTFLPNHDTVFAPVQFLQLTSKDQIVSLNRIHLVFGAGVWKQRKSLSVRKTLQHCSFVNTSMAFLWLLSLFHQFPL